MSQPDFQTGVAHFQAGRLQEAEQVFRDLLSGHPRHVDSLQALGVVLLRKGNLHQAIALITQAIELRPQSGVFHSNLGMAYQALRQYPEAEAAYRRALEIGPTLAGPYFNLANCLKEQQRLSEAIEYYAKAIELQPDLVKAHNNLANCFRAMGRLEEARKSLAWAIQVQPKYAEAFVNLSQLKVDNQELDQAEVACREALRLQPLLIAGWIQLGQVFLARDNQLAAIQAYRQAIAIAPGDGTAYVHLAKLLMDAGNYSQSLGVLREASNKAPNHAEVWSYLAHHLLLKGKVSEADTCFQRAVDLEPDNPGLLSTWLFYQLYRPGISLQSIAFNHHQWNLRFGDKSSKNEPTNGPDKKKDSCGSNFSCDLTPSRRTQNDRPLRVGFVSGDFGQHPIATLCIRTLEALPRFGIEVVTYSTQPHANQLNQRFRQCSSLWRDVKNLPLEMLKQQVEEDNVDILVDLSGHSAGNRLPLFARRAAPVQVTWIGNEGTTGLHTIDFLIADWNHVPPGFKKYYQEQVVRLPNSYVAWDPPTVAPEIVTTPRNASHPITFGSFNNPLKLNNDVIDLWARVLESVPTSRLVLIYRYLNDPGVHSWILNRFSVQGIAADRIECHGWLNYQELLASYNRIHVALDPFPFSGGVTSLEALWMGVPVVTFPQELFASRHTSSYLTTLGFTEWIASSADQYVEIAQGLALDQSRLNDLRSTLRSRIASSPICDGVQLARDLARSLQQMWSGEPNSGQ